MDLDDFFMHMKYRTKHLPAGAVLMAITEAFSNKKSGAVEETDEEFQSNLMSVAQGQIVNLRGGRKDGE